ncbi:MAG: L-threonylcarbamoyladenylate synthase [Candidatus Bathyarchaeia archaeon]
MRVLKATIKNIRIAANMVKKGGVIVYPTDTVYGLGCNPLNEEAVKQVFKVKGERNKPLPILACSIKDAEKIAKFSQIAKKIAGRLWPGPLTMVLPKKSILPSIVTCNQDSVGVRVPNHNVALQLICQSNGILVGTSANKSGQKPPITAEEAIEQVGSEVDIVLNGGLCQLKVSSTVVDLTSEKPQILRTGPISLQEILSIIEKA